MFWPRILASRHPCSRSFRARTFSYRRINSVSPGQASSYCFCRPAVPKICDGRGPPLQEILSVDFGVMQKLIECVPNFSEGRDQNVIRQITDAIESVDGVSLLDVDPGASTNRTVVTLVGSPDAAVEAAFRAIKKAAELIDMRKHKGAHPRMGATDVCPFIPVSNVNWEEAIACAEELGRRVGEELKIPVYLYERAAKDKARSNLSVIRAGEYEGFFEKIKQPEWKPDFGPSVFNEKSGGTVIGVRDFLVAYNV